MNIAKNFILSRASGELSPNSVDIWRWDLDPGMAEYSSYAAMLSEEEKAQARRFQLPAHRRKFTVSHAIVRILLGSHIGCDAKSPSIKRE